MFSFAYFNNGNNKFLWLVRDRLGENRYIMQEKIIVYTLAQKFPELLQATNLTRKILIKIQ